MSDTMFDAYSEWLNDVLFERKAKSDQILWLGNGTWLIASVDDPGDIFTISIRRAKVEQA